MKDAIGQEISVGDIVYKHQGSCMGGNTGLFKVIKVNKSSVSYKYIGRVFDRKTLSYKDAKKQGSHLAHLCVVVTDNVKKMRDNGQTVEVIGEDNV